MSPSITALACRPPTPINAFASMALGIISATAEQHSVALGCAMKHKMATIVTVLHTSLGRSVKLTSVEMHVLRSIVTEATAAVRTMRPPARVLRTLQANTVS